MNRASAVRAGTRRAEGDTHGHEAGDQALRAFGQLLRTVLAPDDLSGRIGGEEFAVVLHAADADAAVTRLEALRAAVPQLAAGGTPAFTASFGVRFTPGGGALSDLLRDADRALYQAKKDGRDRIVLTGGRPCATAAAHDILDLADRLHPQTGAHRER